MRHFDPQQRALVVALALLAGFVDAVGFRALGGLFVSFMSGDTTHMAVDIADASPHAWTCAMILCAFFIGVVLGAALGRWTGVWRRQAVISLVALLLLAGAGLAACHPPAWLTVVVLAIAMGAANNVFERDGEVSVGATYMTGALVKFGQDLVSALGGGPAAAWLTNLLQWLGLLGGAVLGSAAFSLLQLRTLWGAAGFAAAMALFSLRLGPTRSPGN